jgi:hypothetical protein
MRPDLNYIRLVLTVIAIAAVWMAVNSTTWTPQVASASYSPLPAPPPPGGIPDAGKLAGETNQKLDQVNGNLAALASKLDAIIDILRSGKMEIVVKGGEGSKQNGRVDGAGKAGPDAGRER